MKKLVLRAELTIFERLEDLPSEIIQLFNSAIDARSRAYAPYSNFPVGAAVLLDDGSMVSGNNQENASYPVGLCAERTTIHQAGSRYADPLIKALAVVGGAEGKTNSRPIAPCGVCRQAIAEYEQRQKQPISIYFKGSDGPIYKASSIADLLPLNFDDTYL